MRLAAMQRNLNNRAREMTATVECSALSGEQKLYSTFIYG